MRAILSLTIQARSVLALLGGIWMASAAALGAGFVSLKDAPTTEVFSILRDENGDRIPEAIGKTFTLRGVLTLRPMLTNGVWNAFFQDATGGLRLIDDDGRLANPKSSRPNFDEGDEIKVRGVLTQNGFSVHEVRLMGTGLTPTVRDATAQELRSGLFPSQLVRVQGEVVRSSGRDEEIAFYVRDGTGQTPLVFKPDFLLLDKGQFNYRLWKGGKVRVLGLAVRIGGAANEPLSLLLRRPADLEFLPPAPLPPPPPSRTPLYLTLGIAGLLALLALYYWERRRIAESRHQETTKLLHELKRSQAEIKKQASFAQLSPNPVLELFADGTLTYWNEAAQEMTQSLKCAFVKDLLPANVVEVVGRALTPPYPKQECQVKFNDRTVSWSFFPIPEITSVHAYAQDITDRLSLELQLRQAQKIESIGQLAAGVAHDFNNLLAVVQGYTSLVIMRKDLPDNVAEPLQEILIAAERAGNLTRQLLTFSRKQVMEPRPLDMNGLLINLSKMLRRLIGADVKMRFVPHPSPAWVCADPGMMEQVIVNLAINARDAMEGGGELTVSVGTVVLAEAKASVRCESLPGNHVVLTVTDTGCGMDGATLKRIFEPFFTTKEPGKGTGLGLATVQAIAKQHKGWVEVSSNPGKGTTFQVFIPASAEVPSGRPEKLDDSPTAGGTESILVVEDDAALRKLARSVLEQYGYDVHDAPSAAEALAIVRRKERIDLLFTDIVLPGAMNGWKLADAIRAENEQLKIIYSTGFDPDTVNRRFDSLSNHVLLRKPYPLNSLVRTVRDCLDGVSTSPLRATAQTPAKSMSSIDEEDELLKPGMS